MKTKQLNRNFKVDQEVVCTQGTEKGATFKIAAVLDHLNGYSCVKVGEDSSRYYAYDDAWLEAK